MQCSTLVEEHQSKQSFQTNDEAKTLEFLDLAS